MLDGNYSMLLGQPWLRNAKVIHDWGKNLLTIKGNGMISMISITKHLDANTKRPKILLHYDFANGITNEEEILLQAKLELFTIGMTTLLELGTLMSYVVPKTSFEELQFDFLHASKEIIVDEVCMI